MSNNQLHKETVQDNGENNKVFGPLGAQDNSDAVLLKNNSSNDSFKKIDNKKENCVAIEICEKEEEKGVIDTEPKNAGMVLGDQHCGDGLTHIHHVIETDDDANNTQIGNVEFFVGALPFEKDLEYRNTAFTMHPAQATPFPASVLENYEKPSGKLTIVHGCIPKCHCSASKKADKTSIEDNKKCHAIVIFFTGLVFAFSVFYLIFSMFRELMNL